MHGDGGLEFDRSVLSTLLVASFVSASAEIDERPIVRAEVSGYTLRMDDCRGLWSGFWSKSVYAQKVL